MTPLTQTPFRIIGLALALTCLVLILLLRLWGKKADPDDKATAKKCHDCDQQVSLDSFHCSLCRRCTSGYSLHSFWLNQCIGSRNRILYIIFLFLQLLYSCCFAAILLASLIELAVDIRQRQAERVWTATRVSAMVLFSSALILDCAVGIYAGKWCFIDLCLYCQSSTINEYLIRINARKEVKKILENNKQMRETTMKQSRSVAVAISPGSELPESDESSLKRKSVRDPLQSQMSINDKIETNHARPGRTISKEHMKKKENSVIPLPERKYHINHQPSIHRLSQKKSRKPLPKPCLLPSRMISLK